MQQTSASTSFGSPLDYLFRNYKRENINGYGSHL
jgi:hypothetical protein